MMLQSIWINYILMAEFAILAICWWFSGDRLQSLYWLGGLACTIGVTFK